MCNVAWSISSCIVPFSTISDERYKSEEDTAGQQKYELARDIELQAHVQIANGNLSARVP